MTDSVSADTPVAIDRADYTRRGADRIELRLTGRWLGGSAQSGAEPLLVVQVHGRRHRFAPARDDHALPPGAWEARFQLPPWAEPHHEGQAALWVGTAVVPVPLPGAPGGGSDAAPRLPPPPALGEARAWPPEVAPPPAEVRAWPSEVAPPPPEADPVRLAEVFDPTVDTGRTGPLADLLFRESVSALHAELEERSAEVARLQGALADARSELEARAARQAALESAHGDLRTELQELMGAVTAQRDDYERRLTEAEERTSEANERIAAAEAERARVATQLGELTAARDAAVADAADLRHRLATAASGHQHHAAELSALRDQLATAQVSREAAAGEVAGLRAELERLGSELAVTREHQSAQGADLGEAQRLLAEARSLSEQLRSQSSH
jgi:predicted  nucleic acid-binding Zn-ribbon protein